MLPTPWRALGRAKVWVAPLIYASNIDTGSHWELYQPNYNGDGNRITKGNQETVAYLWRRNWDIYFLSVADSSETPVIIGASNEEAPTWSPDGNVIAYASDSDGDYEIYTLLFGRPRYQKITDNTAQDRWPLWAQ